MEGRATGFEKRGEAGSGLHARLARLFGWFDERLDLRLPIHGMLTHPVPAHVRWYHCFGGITLLLFGIQVVTGILLSFYYKPVPDQAYESLQQLVYNLPFGWVRSIHRWAANGMILMVGLHMVRVFATGSYKPPREFNWVVGVLLLSITLAFAVTGFLLPWTQRAYWATMETLGVVESLPVIGPAVAGALRGGAEVGAPTLARFYSLHILVLPIVSGFLLALHFAMVRRQGISGPM
ncbi:MAG: cytochrome b N-terminal domain-containing protein [Firmicutes bacterium]|nr:cytochrome b N-terminal domain-containing protein [Bacillota bacterium]